MKKKSPKNTAPKEIAHKSVESNVYVVVHKGRVAKDQLTAKLLKCGVQAPKSIGLNPIVTITDLERTQWYWGVEKKEAPSRHWEILAAQIFHSSEENSRWGWVSEADVNGLKFWLNFDKNVKIIYIHETLGALVRRQKSYATLELEVDSWVDFVKEAQVLENEFGARVLNYTEDAFFSSENGEFHQDAGRRSQENDARETEVVSAELSIDEAITNEILNGIAEKNDKVRMALEYMVSKEIDTYPREGGQFSAERMFEVMGRLHDAASASRQLQLSKALMSRQQIFIEQASKRIAAAETEVATLKAKEVLLPLQNSRGADNKGRPTSLQKEEVMNEKQKTGVDAQQSAQDSGGKGYSSVATPEQCAGISVSEIINHLRQVTAKYEQTHLNKIALQKNIDAIAEREKQKQFNQEQLKLPEFRHSVSEDANTVTVQFENLGHSLILGKSPKLRFNKTNEAFEISDWLAVGQKNYLGESFSSTSVSEHKSPIDLFATTSQIGALEELVRAMTSELAATKVPTLALKNCQQQMSLWINSPTCESIKILSCLELEEYEHIWFEVQNLKHGAQRWSCFEFRFGAAAIKSMPSTQFISNHPRVEFPKSTDKCGSLSSWFAESTDNFGDKLELRFEITSKAVDINVWNNLLPSDKKLVGWFISILDGVLASQVQETRMKRSKAEWITLAENVHQIYIERCVSKAGV